MKIVETDAKTTDRPPIMIKKKIDAKKFTDELAFVEDIIPDETGLLDDLRLGIISNYKFS